MLVLVSLSLIMLPDRPQRQLASYIEDFALYPFRQVRLTGERMLSLWETNRQLSEEVEALRLELRRTAEVRLENRRLREMLLLSPRPELQLVGCEILAEGGGRLGGQTLLLDRGALHGIRRDMPVIGRDGLAGKVYEVYPETARAFLLTHRWCAVSVRDQRSRLTGIVEWNPRSGATLKLRGVTYLEDVAPGDSLVTSGLSGLFPAGLAVGEVVDVARDVNGLLLDVTVRPALDFARLEQVFVLMKRPEGAAERDSTLAAEDAARILESMESMESTPADSAPPSSSVTHGAISGAPGGVTDGATSGATSADAVVELQ